MNWVHPQAAYRWLREGGLPVPARRLVSGTIWVDTVAGFDPGGVVLSARVSVMSSARVWTGGPVGRVGHRLWVPGGVVCGSGPGVDGQRVKGARHERR